MAAEELSPIENESSQINMSHQEMMSLVEKEINQLVQADPLLSYLPSGVTLEELNSLLGLEHGRAISLVVERADGDFYKVVVDQDATVLDLKRSIQYHFTLKQTREGNKRLVSWKYVWKRFWLYFEGQKLTPDSEHLKNFGIKNNAKLTFIKRLRNKN